MTTSINVARAIAKLVAVDALPAIMGHMVLGNLVERDFEPTLAQMGDTVQTPRRTVTFSNGMAEATFQIPDVTKVLAVPELLQLYMQPACMAIAEYIDTRILEQMLANFADVGQGEKALDEAENLLWQQRGTSPLAKTILQTILVTGGQAYQVLRRQTGQFYEYESPATAGSRVLIQDSVGLLRTMLVCRSKMLPSHQCVAFRRETATLAIRRLPMVVPGTGAVSEYSELGNFGIRVVMDYAPNTLRQTFQLSILAGVSVDPAQGVKFEMKEKA